MPQARGTQTEIALFEETTYGTTPGTPSGQKLYVTSCGIVATQAMHDSETLNSNRERTQPARGNITPSGPIAMECSAQAVGTLLKHAMGVNNTTGASPYVHTMTLGDLPVGLVIEKDFGSNISGSGRYQYFNGCRIGGAAFSFPNDGYATMNFDIIGASETLSATPLDATLDENGHTSFTTFSATIEEGGSAIATVETADINLDNGLDDSVFVVGGAGTRVELPEGFATVSGSITALFDDMTLMNKAINGTQSSLKIILSRGDGLGSAGNESIEFFVQQLEYERTSPAIEGPGGIKITLNYKAFLSGSTSALQIIVKNAVATI